MPLPDSNSASHPESVRGGIFYHQILELLHQGLAPELYLEIGVRNGGSLRLAKSLAFGVDPAANITFPLGSQTTVIGMTSDDFFASRADACLNRPIDLAFIDGMHLFEFALRDFINIEKRASPYTVVVVDDVCPNHPLQAKRNRETRVWTGDIWKLRHCLERYRPDLHLVLLDTSPTGLMLIYGLDPDSTALQDNAEEIAKTYLDPDFETPPVDVIQRKGVVQPDLSLLGSVLRGARAIRHSRGKPEDLVKLFALVCNSLKD